MAKGRKDLGSYWERRTREREEKWNRKCREQLERETARQYNAALRSIEKDIMALYGTFASDNGLTMQDARKLLHGQEFRQWRMGMKEYIEEIHHAEETGQLAKSAGLMRELNTLAMRSRISRLDKLRSETLMELDSLGRKRETAMGRFLADAYRDNYYRSLFEIGKEAGLKGSFAKADSKAVEELLRTPWSGKNYSERIWVDMRKLETTIRDNIVQGIHRGVSASKMTKAVMDRMNVSRSNAERLVRTELCYVQNQASLGSIRESGMGFYRVCAAFDKRTCTKCASKDGIEVPVDEASPGDTLPPFHARCRCSIIASFGDGKTSKGKRIARDSEGRNIKVPADMKYSDWKAVYVDGSKTLSEWQKSQKTTSTYPAGNAILIAEKKITDIKAEISARQAKIDALEAQRENIDTIAEASAITRKQQALEDEIRDLKRKLEDAKEDLTAQKNIEKYGNPYGFNKIEGRHTRRQDLKATNPNFTKGGEYHLNCQRCVAAYDARRKGFDIEALPRTGPQDEFFQNWRAMYKNPDVISCIGSSGDDCRRLIEEKMAGFGDGSRAIIAVNAFDGSGHVFIAEQIRGRTYFLEPQSGIWYKDLMASPFTNCDPRRTELLRVDDIEFNQKISQCVKNKDG